MVSVCIPTYNGDKYVYEQLQSILSQLSEEDEIIISDDSSSDSTIQIIEGILDPRIILLRNNKYRSPILNLENALNHARGDYIFLADQDDIWLPCKVQEVKSYLCEYDLVVTDCIIVNGTLDILNESYFLLTHSGKGLIKNLIKNSYLGCCMAFKKEMLKKVLPFPKGIPMHDIWIGFIAELFFSSVFINKKFSLYRRHGNNASTTTEISPFSYKQRFLFRWNLVKHLPELLFR